MFNLYAGVWLAERSDPTEDRALRHRVALREARIGAVAHARGADAFSFPALRQGRVAGLRLAVPGLSSRRSVDAACCA